MYYTFKNISLIGFFLGIITFIVILSLPIPQSFIEYSINNTGIPSSNEMVIKVANGMKITLGLLCLMVIWWLTEAIPIPITGLLPAIMLPFFKVHGWQPDNLFEFTFQKTLANYAHPVIGLFFGCFLLAAAIRKFGTDKRLTFWILTKGKIADSPKKTLLVIMYLTAFVSMWISNTATVAIMLPIAIGILTQTGGDIKGSNFGIALMLGIAWAASIGGVGTIIGSPPNGIAISILSQNQLPTLNFLDWMKIGIPYVIIFIPVCWFLLSKIYPYKDEVKINQNFLLHEKSKLGNIGRGEYLTGGVFLVTVILWISNPFWKYLLPDNIFDSFSWIDEYSIGFGAGLILFFIPFSLKKFETVLHWKDTRHVDWGTLILFGGGLALSDVMFKTGLAGYLANSFVYSFGTPPHFLLLFLIIVLMSFMTEITSNTAITSMMVPILIAIAANIGIDPTTFVIGAAIAASMAFMLPVATPPNALVYGTGYVKLSNMIKAGFWLDIVGCFLTFSVLYIFGYLIFKLLII